MPRAHVVGSGPSGVHFAWTLLERGWDVTLLDVGRSAEEPVRPDAHLLRLKDELDDPVAYFLGRDASGVVFPSADAEVYGFPPGRQFIFDAPPDATFEAEGFAPLLGWAQGGLAEAWTAGCYPFNAAEVADFPVDPESLFDAYGVVAQRIGVTGDPSDDLGRFYPEHEGLMPPLPTDGHSTQLEARYRAVRHRLNRRGVFLGRTRVATLSRDHDGRPSCSFCGRCLWGCPTGSLYTPSITLARCQESERFTYKDGLRVLRFEAQDGNVEAVIAQDLRSGGTIREPVDRLALAAGALGTTEIVLRSQQGTGREGVRLGGLMDNRQILMPFLNLRRVGRAYEPQSYQYHLLGMGLAADDPRHYVHCQLTTLGTAMMHPVVQKLPFGMKVGGRVAALMHGALGLVNINFHDTRRDGNRVWVEGEAPQAPLKIEYAAPDDEPARTGAAVAALKKALRTLGCIVPPGMLHTRPMGASVHYAGTLPMGREDRAFTTHPDGRLRPYNNLWIADGASFPFLPAKNLTFTLMANATRIAASLS